MKTKLLLIIFVLASAMTFGQKKLADKFFKNYAYIKASELYEEAYNNGDDSEHVLTRLGDCYYNNSNPAQAAVWYKRALDNYRSVDAEYIYKYIQTQRSLGNYNEADTWLDTFKDVLANDRRGDLNDVNLSMYDELSSTEQKYIELQNLDINSNYSDFGSFVHNGKLYFASTRDTGGKIYKWNEQPFLDIYQANIAESEGIKTYSGVDFIPAEDVNSDYHEASIAITSDGQTMYFTRDNVNKRKRLNYNKKGTTHLKLYKANLENGEWTNVKELPFNDNEFSTGHPTLSVDEKQLYFVSDREGGLGQTDIYVVDILENGKYSEPRNLGEMVNTEGREMFPYVAKDSTLYFSSDGFLNIGLLDIFKSEYIKDNSAQPQNMGAPYNSGYDDFAMYIDPETETGYFSSNREGGKGNDDIYSFAAYDCKQVIKGVVRDTETLDAIADATVQLIDENGKIIDELKSSEDGEYSFEVDCDNTYTVLGTKVDYKDDKKEVETDKENNKEHQADLNLHPLIKDNQIVINPIFFDFDKWNIRTDAKYELENIVDVLRQHPTMVIKIESHTDSRGSDRYNEKLSDRRAKSTRDYLLSRNIAPERIESAIGYGETQLLNECEDGVRCSETKHQENRRSYFYILKN